jgi:hypothetical protein
MARKRRTARRASRSYAKRSYSPTFRKKARRSKGKSGGMMSTIIGGVGYGAVRAYLSQAIAPLTSKLPIGGQYADEIGLGLANYLLAKGKVPLLNKIPMTRNIGKAGLVVESAFIGQQLISGGLFNITKQNGNTLNITAF